jgi:FkbM family methyltransferase
MPPARGDQEATQQPRGRPADAPRLTGGVGPQGWSTEVLRKKGIAPATIIDVGAGDGTGPLLRAFPDAYHVLIEPQAELEPSLRRHLEKLRGEVLITAVGDHEGEALLYVDANRPMTSSLYEPQAGAAREARPVPLAKLDRLAAERGWEAPFGLKIDAEGADHLVIEGATEVLKQCQFVIAEVLVTLARSEHLTYAGGLTFAQFIALMDTRGFELRDILDAPRSRATGQVLCVDGYFMPSAA